MQFGMFDGGDLSDVHHDAKQNLMEAISLAWYHFVRIFCCVVLGEGWHGMHHAESLEVNRRLGANRAVLLDVRNSFFFFVH